jgi:hypothetical protein
MNDYVEELVNHRKFIDLPEDEVDEKLKKEKNANPKSIPYALCWMEMHPGYASLRFVASENARGHLIGINPKGFAWGDNNFSSLDQLINAFKKNPKGSKKASGQSLDTAQKNVLENKPAAKNRWGDKPAPPILPPPPAPSGWARPPPPHLPPVPPPMQPVSVGVGWSAQPPAAPVWGQGPPPLRPLPPNLPPPPAYGQPPPLHRPPPPNLPPPPPPPPPPAGPPAYVQQQQPAFAMPSGPSQGRGRGRTLPAWMSKTES